MSGRQYESGACPAALRHGSKPWRAQELKPVEQFAGGGFATVQKCSFPGLEGFVILKTFHAAKCTDEYEIQQVDREITVQKRVRHANIVDLFAAFEDEAGKHLVLEFVNGNSISKQRADAGGYLSEGDAAGGIIGPLLTAVDHLHHQGIVHRDIKPGNLRYNGAGILKLLDFGLAVDTKADAVTGRVGTLDYMPPEIIQQSADSEVAHPFAVDVWAVGVLAYELLVGGPPFEAQTKAETFRRITDTEAFIPGHLSDAAKSFLKQALSKNPQMRPSAGSLLLHKWIAQSKA